MTFKTFAFALALASGALTVLIQDAEARGGPRGGERAAFEEVDADGDGAVTRAELEAHRAARAAERFARFDADGDGLVTEAELTARGRARAAERAGRLIDRLDADGDGALSAAEMSTSRGDRFARADRDGDGSLSEAEWTGWRARR